jgi:CBS domain-containing protein
MEAGTAALFGVRAGPSIRLVCLPLGLPTTSARAPSASPSRKKAGSPLGRDVKVEDACRPGLFTVDVDDSLEVAAHRMDQAQLGALAVVDGQRVVGTITERGLVRAIARAADPADVPVAAYASSSPHTASVEQDARAVVQRMLVLGVRHLPVTSRDGQLIGMVSMRDLLAVEAWA